MAVRVFRKEIKYVMDYIEAQKIEGIISKVLSKDKHSDQEAYFIRSLYFDSINNHDFNSKMNGDEERKKIRLRLYDLQTEWVKIEIKYKKNINQIKESILISRQDAKALIGCHYGVLLKYENDIASKLYNIMTIGQYRPVVIVDYYRRAYLHKENDLRITFDMDIRQTEANFNIFDESLVLNPIFPEEDLVLEVKYDNEMYGWVRELLKGRYHSNRSMSKYCSSRTWLA